MDTLTSNEKALANRIVAIMLNDDIASNIISVSGRFGNIIFSLIRIALAIDQVYGTRLEQELACELKSPHGIHLNRIDGLITVFYLDNNYKGNELDLLKNANKIAMDRRTIVLVLSEYSLSRSLSPYEFAQCRGFYITEIR